MLDKDQVWRNLLEYIDSQEMFFPAKVRGHLNPAAEEIFDEFMSLMLRHRMLIHFKRSGLVNRFAYIIFWLKKKLFSRDRRVPEIYVKGPGWREPGGQSLDEILSSDPE